MKCNIKVNIINAPTYGISKKETLSDLCAVTGATLINEDLGDDMDLISVEHLGTCLKAVSTNEDTILQVDLTDNTEVNETIARLEKLIKETTNPNVIVRYEKRLAKLKAKVAIVKVGANSEVNRKSTHLNYSHLVISYAVFCLKKKKKKSVIRRDRTQRGRRGVGKAGVRTLGSAQGVKRRLV